MEAKEFVKEMVRMFDSVRAEYKGSPSCDGVPCNGCLMFDETIGCISYSEQAVDLVEQRSKEHPIKTIKMDFLEKYPNATIGRNGTPEVCCAHLGYEESSACVCWDVDKCIECWNRPLEEVE